MAYVLTLTQSDIEFGQKLVAELRTWQFAYQGVLWLFDEQADDWKLVIATEMVDKLGPRETYLRLSGVTKGIPASDFQLLRISVISPLHPVYAALRSVFASAKSVEGARLEHTTVNGLSVTAYLYEIR
jgi:hypothetical protein